MTHPPVEIKQLNKDEYHVNFKVKNIFTKEELRYLIQIIDNKIG